MCGMKEEQSGKKQNFGERYMEEGQRVVKDPTAQETK